MLNAPSSGKLRCRRLMLLVRIAASRGMQLLFAIMRSHSVRPEDAARSFRSALEALGLTYLKLGQFLATRHDVVPTTLVRELTGLFEQVPALPAGTVFAIIEQEFGAPTHALFSSFKPLPIAAATVAQVHRATLIDGMRVAVKVQRPGIESIFEADIANLRLLACLIDWLGILGALSVEEIVEESQLIPAGSSTFLWKPRPRSECGAKRELDAASRGSSGV
jgi:ubiquinone biosynthesis protein